jgi:hypothetical protein
MAEGEARQRAIEDAYARGQIDATAKLEAEFEVRLDTGTAQLRRQLEAEFAHRSDEHSAQLAKSFAAMLQASLAGLEKALTEKIAGVLKPLVLNAAEKAAVMEIVRGMGNLREDGLTKVRVMGPVGLIEALTSALPSLKFETAPSQDIELNIRIDETEFTTRLAHWRQSHFGAGQ